MQLSCNCGSSESNGRGRFWGLVAAFALVPLTALIYGYSTRSAPDAPAVPLGLDPVQWSWKAPYSAARVELGRNLFFDARLSSDASVSCASCHDPLSAFSLSEPFATGVHGQRGNRKPPTIINAAYNRAQFWDGRAATLEEQATGPLMNPVEMATSPATLVATLNRIPGYRPLFRAAFADDNISVPRIAEAIAAFERTVLSGNSAYDRMVAGDRAALSPSQLRGIAVFRAARCNACHDGKAFTNGAMANLGVGTDRSSPDPGLSAITHKDADWGRFKTPGLRDVALRAPYMHDGSLHTLGQVVDFYDRGGIPNRNLDNRIRPLHLTTEQKSDLVAFLRSLNGEGWQNATPPEALPR